MPAHSAKQKVPETLAADHMDAVNIVPSSSNDALPAENNVLRNTRVQPTQYGLHTQLVTQERQPVPRVNPQKQLQAATIEIYNEKRKERLRVYLRQTFFAHFVALIVAAGVEFSFLALCVNVTTRAPHHVIVYQADSVKAAQMQVLSALGGGANSTQLNEERANLSREVETFLDVIRRENGFGAKLFMYEIIYGSAALLMTLFVAAVVYHNRSHPAVRSRGILYLCLIFVSAFFCEAVTVFVSAATLLRFDEFPLTADYTQPYILDRELHKSATYILVSFSVMMFAVSLFLSVILMRQHMIAEVFSSLRVMARPSTTKGPLIFLAITTILGLIIGASGHLWWYLSSWYHPDDIYIGITPVLVYGSVYGMAFMYFMFRARLASLQFNDFFCNFRFILVCESGFGVLILYCYINPHHLISGSAGWASIVRSIVSLQLVDTFFTQMIQARWEVDKLPEVQGVSFVTARRLLNWSLQPAAAPQIMITPTRKPTGLVTRGPGTTNTTCWTIHESPQFGHDQSNNTVEANSLTTDVAPEQILQLGAMVADGGVDVGNTEPVNELGIPTGSNQ